MSTTGRRLLLHSAAVLHDNAPGIIPTLTVVADRRTLDRQFRHSAQAILIGIAEDLLLSEIEPVQVILHPAQHEGEKAGRQIGRDSDGLIAFAVGVILQHDANAGVGPEPVRLLLALSVHVCVVLNRCRLELVRELTQFLIGHVDCDLILNTVVFHLDIPHFQSS